MNKISLLLHHIQSQTWYKSVRILQNIPEGNKDEKNKRSSLSLAEQKSCSPNAVDLAKCNANFGNMSRSPKYLKLASKCYSYRTSFYFYLHHHHFQANSPHFYTFSHQRRAIRTGVVRQEVKRSAGSSGFIGNNSFLPQAASKMQLKGACC